MAKLVTKFKYLKPDSGKGTRGCYAKYIATREGVDKIDESKKYAPATKSQQNLIAHILHDFPDSKEMLEYEDYIRQSTISNASEFITRAMEDNTYAIMQKKTYADYIATRPRAERVGSHGLFTDDGVEVNLTKVSEELNQHGGNIWTAIISLRREDAERLGYNSGSRWRDMLRTQTKALATNLKIPMENLRWFAAFHNESHHPHVHLIAYSCLENEGYLTKKGVANLRSAFVKDIFAQDLLCIYEKQTEHRTTLKQKSKKIIEEVMQQLGQEICDNQKIEELLITLSDKLKRTSGKKIYGYLKADVKNMVDAIMEELSKDERIRILYDLWYEQREMVLRTYTRELPDRKPMVQNKEFKSIKNMIIQEAMKLRFVMRMDEEENLEEPEPMLVEEESIEKSELLTVEEDNMKDPKILNIENNMKKMNAVEEKKIVAESSPLKSEMENMWSQYGFAKLLLDKNSEYYNPQEAAGWLTASAKQGCTVAQYMLGKLFLSGKDVPKNVDLAVKWLEKAIEQNNGYAEYLLGKHLLRGLDMEQDIDRAVKLLSASAKQRNRYAGYTLGKAYLDGELLPRDLQCAISLLTMSADLGFSTAQYVLGKLLYLGEVTEKDVGQAVRYLKQAANQENSYAEYQLGKIYLYGDEVEHNYKKAIEYLQSSAEHGNRYAEQLLFSIRSSRNCYAGTGMLRLLHHMSKILQSHLDDETAKGRGIRADHKLKQKIDEKKQAHGLKQG